MFFIFIIWLFDSEIYNLRGGTHLHAAVYFDKPVVVQWFLDNHADAKLKTKVGKTALDIAREKGHLRCEEILKGRCGDRYSSRRQSVARVDWQITSMTQSYVMALSFLVQ